jgi:hypothetical protein
MSAALRGLQPRSPQQRSAVILLSTRLRQCNCNKEEREAMQAAGFVSAVISWLPSFRSNPTRVRVLLAACELAQPQQLAPLMNVLLPDLMAADEKRLDTAALVLFNTSRSLNLPLQELFGSEEAAAGVAARLVQLLAHASDEIFRAVWLICCQLSVNVINRQLLLNAGLLQPAHFVRAMASSHVGVRIDSIVLLNLTTRGTARVLIERGLLPVILAACADTVAKVVANGISGLHSCVLAAEQPNAAQLRPIVLQACTPFRDRHSSDEH